MAPNHLYTSQPITSQSQIRDSVFFVHSKRKKERKMSARDLANISAVLRRINLMERGQHQNKVKVS